ncbi:hypothetical protein SSP24_06360 [Streptomyces spinoverrucosus]|uniref:Uncharacterized protein n=1 Tax=Streptomyces spinoverrucosus TaxID=284043 RepID=A0A4Y3VBQ4_9ACTN|nr:hypothetical protein [Streptomyces spinoverrucosus]GEC02981.1 hypothetical protein SSP24_06360 [Streptomyces spinoverrucosus]GHB39110.1 hypothetical protein GCM10010397_06230 [Streptomyces spinoverrucosus]
MAGWWAPAELYGLWVDCGVWHYHRRVWLRLPWARFTCQHGCVSEAFGPTDVAHLTARIDHDHARACPGPREEPTRG